MLNQKSEQKITVEISPAELRLLEYLRKIKWGSVEITIQNALPVVIKAAVQTIKLM